MIVPEIICSTVNVLFTIYPIACASLPLNDTQSVGPYEVTLLTCAGVCHALAGDVPLLASFPPLAT